LPAHALDFGNGRPHFDVMIVRALTIVLLLSAPALAQSTYPVTGKWGQSAGDSKGAIDCAGKRVMSFEGNQRTDSGGGVPAYRNRSVTTDGASKYRVVDEFSNGMMNDAHTSYTLRKLDNDHIEMQLQSGGTLKLQRCK
jgi:hypothetical protein